jgi:hypothetical protein
MDSAMVMALTTMIGWPFSSMVDIACSGNSGRR